MAVPRLGLLLTLFALVLLALLGLGSGFAVDGKEGENKKFLRVHTDIVLLETPTETPTEAPTEAPTHYYSSDMAEAATEAPTVEPTETPTYEPTEMPTPKPTKKPHGRPLSHMPHRMKPIFFPPPEKDEDSSEEIE